MGGNRSIRGGRGGKEWKERIREEGSKNQSNEKH